MSLPLFSRTFLFPAILLLRGIARGEDPKPEETYDFGKGIEGNEVRHEFKIANPGTAPLEIESATTSCPCTKVLSFPKRLAPGKSGAISVVLTMDKTGPRMVQVAAVVKGQKTPRLFVICGDVWSAP